MNLIKDLGIKELCELLMTKVTRMRWPFVSNYILVINNYNQYRHWFINHMLI